MNTDDTPTTAPEESLDTWAIIELFGHNKIAGKVTNVAIAGCGFIRVDVPEHGGTKPYTRHIAPKAVYAINPCDEAAARCALEHISESPVVAICRSDIYASMNKEREERLRLNAPPEEPDDTNDDENDGEDEDRDP